MDLSICVPGKLNPCSSAGDAFGIAQRSFDLQGKKRLQSHDHAGRLLPRATESRQSLVMDEGPGSATPAHLIVGAARPQLCLRSPLISSICLSGTAGEL